MLPKRRCDFDTLPDDEYERVSVRDIQLLDPTPSVIVAPEPASLSPMAIELEETVIALTRRPAARPAAARPSVASIATIFCMSTVMSLTATLILRGGEVPAAHVAAAALVAPQAAPALPVQPASAPSPVVPEASEPEPEAGAIAISIPVTSLPAAPVAAAPARVTARRRAVPAAAAAVPPAAPAAAQADARREEPATAPSPEPATSEPASNEAAQPAQAAEEPTGNTP